MPTTNVFFGTTSLTRNRKNIAIEGRGDSAQVTVTYEKQNAMSTRVATIQTYTLSELRKTDTFITAINALDIEILANTWYTKLNHNTIIKYAADNQLAFVITATTDANEVLQLLSEFPGILPLDYFTELEFCNNLDSQLETDIEKLKTAHGIDDARITFFLNHSNGFFDLYKKGFTLTQLGAMPSDRINTLLANNFKIQPLLNYGITTKDLEIIELARLQQYFSDYHNLESILQFITIRQLFGLDSTPLKLNTPLALTSEDKVISGHFGGGSVGDEHGELSYQSDDDTIKMKYRDNATQRESHSNLAFRTLDEASLQKYASKMKDTVTVELVHRWHIVSTKTETGNATTIFSPDLRYVVEETCSDDFPEISPDRKSLYLHSVAYYKELRFAGFLQQHDYTIPAYKKLSGMSQSKLELICQHVGTLSQLTDQSLKIEELAGCDEARLRHFVENYYQAKDALKFVSPTELLALKPASRRASLGLFHSITIEDEKTTPPQPGNGINQCRLM